MFRHRRSSRPSATPTVESGQPPQLANNQGDFFLCRRDGERTLHGGELCIKPLPDHMGIPADQIQVLMPTRKAQRHGESEPLSSGGLNAGGQTGDPVGERLFRTGDRIAADEKQLQRGMGKGGRHRGHRHVQRRRGRIVRSTRPSCWL